MTQCTQQWFAFHQLGRREIKARFDAPNARKRRQVDWITYDDHHRHWHGQNGGRDPAAAYPRILGWAILMDQPA